MLMSCVPNHENSDGAMCSSIGAGGAGNAGADVDSNKQATNSKYAPNSTNKELNLTGILNPQMNITLGVWNPSKKAPGE